MKNLFTKCSGVLSPNRNKIISEDFRIGQAPVKGCNEYLRDLIVNGRAKPSKIVSHQIDIDDAPNAPGKFDQRIEGYTKVLIRFVGSPVTAAAD